MVRKLVLLALIALCFGAPPAVLAADQLLDCADAMSEADASCCPEDDGADCNITCAMRCAVTPAAAPSLANAAVLCSMKFIGFVGVEAPEWNTAPPTPPPNGRGQQI